MSDACGCSDEKNETGEAGEEAEGFWQVREVRFAAAAGVLLLAGWILSLAGVPLWVALSLETGALLAAGWTFVPSTLRRLAKGRIGVGTLMTIAAVADPCAMRSPELMRYADTMIGRPSDPSTSASAGTWLRSTAKRRSGNHPRKPWLRPANTSTANGSTPCRHSSR